MKYTLLLLFVLPIFNRGTEKQTIPNTNPTDTSFCFDCDSMVKAYEAFYELHKNDSIVTSRIIPLSNEYQSKTLLCKYINEAMNDSVLSIFKSHGMFNSPTDCEIQSYENFGIKYKACAFSDIIFENRIDSLSHKLDAYNFVMFPRVKRALGDKFDQLGKIDSTKIIIIMDSLYHIAKSLTLIATTDSTVTLQLKKDALMDYEDIVLKDGSSESILTLAEMKEPFTLRKEQKFPERRTAMLLYDSKLQTGNYCLSSIGVKIGIPLIIEK